jgi:hypothetical protein
VLPNISHLIRAGGRVQKSEHRSTVVPVRRYEASSPHNLNMLSIYKFAYLPAGQGQIFVH